MKKYQQGAVVGARSRRDVMWIRFAIAVVAALASLKLLIEAAVIVAGHALIVGQGADGGLPLTVLPGVEVAILAPGQQGDLRDADPVLRAFASLPLLIEAATIVAGTAMLLAVLRQVAAGRSFEQRNLGVFRMMSLTFLWGGIAAGLMSSASNVYLVANAGPVDSDTRAEILGARYSDLVIGLPQWPLPLVIAGLVAIAIRVALDAGARYSEEADGVI
ncbi:hypothetical protein ACU6RU_09020 [Microbacterium sp. F1-18]